MAFRYITYRIMFMTIFSLCTFVNFAQTNDMQKLCENIEKELLNGKTEKAIKYYNQAVEIINNDPDSLDLYKPLMYSSIDIFPSIIRYISEVDSSNASSYINDAFDIWCHHLDILSRCNENLFYQNSIKGLNWAAKYYSDSSFNPNNLFDLFVDKSIHLWSKRHELLSKFITEKDYYSICALLEYYYSIVNSEDKLSKYIRLCRMLILYTNLTIELDMYQYVNIDELISSLVETYANISLSFFYVEDYDINNSRDLKNEYALFRSVLIEKFGREYYDKMINKCKENSTVYDSDIFATESYDNFLDILINIKNGELDKSKDNVRLLLSNTINPDVLIKYTEYILAAYDEYGLKDISYDFLSKVEEYCIKNDYKNHIVELHIEWARLALYNQDVNIAHRILSKYISNKNLKTEYSYLSVKQFFSLIEVITHLCNIDEDWTRFKYFSQIAENLIPVNHSNIDIAEILDFYELLIDYYKNIEQDFKQIEHYKAMCLDITNFSLNDESLPLDNSLFNLTRILINHFVIDYYDNHEYEKAADLVKKCLEFYINISPTHFNTGVCNLILVKVYEKMGITDSLKHYYSEYYNFIIKNFTNKTFSLSQNDRHEFWQDYSTCLEYASARSLNYPVLSGINYNFALLQKNTMSRYDIFIRENIYNSHNKELIKLYEDYSKAVINRSNRQYELEKNLMSQYSSNYKFSNTFNTATWESVERSLNQGEIAVEFTLCPKGPLSSYAVLLLKRGWKEPTIIELCTIDNLEKIIALGSKLYQQNDDAFSYIWEKLEPYLDGVENIYFAPHGLIHQMNIEVLAGKDGIPMNKKYNVYRVSSTGNLVNKREDSKYSSATLFGGLNYDTDTTSLVAMSRNYSHISPSRDRLLRDTVQTRAGWSYLPGTATEVKNVSSILGKNRVETKIFTDEMGTEESFKALSGNSPSIIHIATHGFYLEDKKARRVELFSLLDDRGAAQISPLKRSGLMFSGGQHAWLGKDIPEGIDDGVLTAEEIAGMNLSGTDLLVLSACQTGLGEITSEGVEGLQKGFKIASVNTIIMSLWEVSDVATETMMITFYKNLTKGKSKREAFDKAVEAVKKKYPLPEYWAAFVMLD